MRKIFLIIICGLLLSCSKNSNDGVIKGQIFKGSEGIAPGVNCEIVAEGTSGYKGPEIRIPIDPNTGNFEASINLGASSSTPPVTYVATAQFNLFLKVKGIWISPDTTAVKPFYENAIVESGKETDIGPWVFPVSAF